MAETFIISDTHFGHANIIKFANRPFKTAEVMDEVMIANWNKVVSPGDTVYHLGDVYFGNFRAAETILRRLNGSKVLIVGNHDDPRDPALTRCFRMAVLERHFTNLHLLLTHMPVHPELFELTQRKLVNVHGHIHDTASPKGPYINACVEWTDYTPIHIEEYSKKALDLLPKV